MLRLASRARGGVAMCSHPTVPVQRSLSTAQPSLPSVQESTVNVTFVNLEGKRLTVPAFPGQNLIDVARAHKVELEGPCAGLGLPVQSRNSATWTEDLYGEGPKCNHCHVMIPQEFHEKLEPPFDGEVELLQELDNLYAPGASRLGCQVKLSKALDGITVYIPDGPPINGV